MLSAIIVDTPELRDTFANTLHLEKKPSENPRMHVYKRAHWILIFAEWVDVTEVVDWAIADYNPEKIYLPFFALSIDLTHEIGDVVLPNVFFHYDDRLSDITLDEENRDQFLGQAEFLEIYDEQKDYYVEDYGLSVGGIVVDRVPESISPELEVNLMMAYEWDLYTSRSFRDHYNVASEWLVPIMLLGWIISGKNPKHLTDTPLVHTARNIMTTIRMLDGEE